MNRKNVVPLVSNEVKVPQPTAWLYDNGMGKRDAQLHQAHPDLMRENREHGVHFHEQPLFSGPSMKAFAIGAVIEEGCLITSLVERCKSILESRLNRGSELEQVCDDALEILAELQKLIERKANPDSWNSGPDL